MLVRLSLFALLSLATSVGLQSAVFEAYVAGGDKAIQQGDFAGAEKLFQMALKESESSPPLSLARTKALNRLGFLYAELAPNYPQAETLYKKALALAEKRGKEDIGIPHQLRQLANLYRDWEKYAESEVAFRRAAALQEKLRGRDSVEVAQLLRWLADVSRLRGKFAEAGPLYKQALALLEKHKGQEFHIASALGGLGEVYRKQDQLAQAEPLSRQALAMLEKLQQSSPLSKGLCLHTLAQIAQSRGKYDEAAALYKQAVDGFGTAPSVYVAPLLEDYARVVRQQGQAAEADRLQARATELREKHAQAKAGK
jgi:tetratricopeptide (TPR) repeat protein